MSCFSADTPQETMVRAYTNCVIIIDFRLADSPLKAFAQKKQQQQNTQKLWLYNDTVSPI